MPQPSKFSHESTDSYPTATEFHIIAVQIASEPGFHFLRNPLERASVRILVALAEAPECRLDKASPRFHLTATAAARKCAALLLALSVRQLITPERHERARELLLKLIEQIDQRFSMPSEPRPRAAKARPVVRSISALTVPESRAANTTAPADDEPTPPSQREGGDEASTKTASSELEVDHQIV